MSGDGMFPSVFWMAPETPQQHIRLLGSWRQGRIWNAIAACWDASQHRCCECFVVRCWQRPDLTRFGGVCIVALDTDCAGFYLPQCVWFHSPCAAWQQAGGGSSRQQRRSSRGGGGPAVQGVPAQHARARAGLHALLQQLVRWCPRGLSWLCILPSHTRPLCRGLVAVLVTGVLQLLCAQQPWLISSSASATWRF